jgi:transcriptional regulator with XRE-family HTH domain
MTERRWVVRSSADLGAAIAEIRAERGLTQADTAELAGLDRSWLAKIENGRTSRLVDQTLRVLRRLGATVTVSFSVDDDVVAALDANAAESDRGGRV